MLSDFHAGLCVQFDILTFILLMTLQPFGDAKECAPMRYKAWSELGGTLILQRSLCLKDILNIKAPTVGQGLSEHWAVLRITGYLRAC